VISSSSICTSTTSTRGRSTCTQWVSLRDLRSEKIIVQKKKAGEENKGLKIKIVDNGNSIEFTGKLSPSEFKKYYPKVRL
jgi:hypothetical protein